MRDIDLTYTIKNNNHHLDLIFDGKVLSSGASSEAIKDCDEMFQINIMKELIKMLVGQVQSELKDITEDEQTKLDSLVLEWIRECAPEKDMTRIHVKKG